jgi:hypothetical protein
MFVQTASDNFTRANGAIGGNWTASVGGAVILSNTAAAAVPSSGAGNRNNLFWSAQSFPNDQYADGVIASVTTGAFAGPVVRGSAGGEHGYICLVPPTGVSGSVIVQQAPTNLSILVLPGITPQIGDVFRIAAVGTLISVYQNGAFLGSIVDSSLVSGAPGIFLFPNGNGQTAAELSSWAGGYVSSGGGGGDIGPGFDFKLKL